MKLSELKTGEKGIIVKVLGHGGFRKRIIEMGFIKGKEHSVIRRPTISRWYLPTPPSRPPISL